MVSKINKVLTNQTQTFSNEELANVSASLSAILGQSSGGEQCASAWLPTITEDGDISWTLTSATIAPATANIMGPQGETGPQGTSGTNGKDGYSIELQSVTDEDGGKKVTLSWGETPSTSSFVIPSGAQGADGKDGADGFSPIMSFTEAATSVAHKNGGTVVTFTYGASGSQSTAYTAWNGNDGSGGGGSTYTAGEGISIDDDVISFSGAQVAAQEYVLAGNGTVESPFNTSSFYENYLENLAAVNGDVAVVSAAVAAMGGAIKIIGNASCTYINNLQTSNIQPGDAYIATTDGTVDGLDVETGQWKSFTVHSGDMVVLSISNNAKVVSVLATTPNLTQYTKLNQRTIVKAGVGVTVSHTENSDGAVEYTVNTVGGSGEGTLSAYTVTCSGDNRFDFERSVDPVTSAINYNMTTTMPNFINVTATPTGTLTPNSYYFVYEE